jgi:metallo-beta-lactamase family protein
VPLWDGAHATFHDAGHILGSASILLELEENGRHRRILFSGDIGPENRPLLNGPAPPSPVDVVVMETTYGDRDHRPLDASVAEFLDAVRDADDRGGNVIIPTFALERAQELLFFLREGMEKQRGPPRHAGLSRLAHGHLGHADLPSAPRGDEGRDRADDP